MRIVADENIPALNEAFGRFGEVRAKAGRRLVAADLEGAEALLVRSVTRVDATLLRGSALRFVGSTTIGVDHVDLAYLAARDIAFANAPGCNADAAAQYVLAALCALAEEDGRDLAGLRVGIVGCGSVGSRLQRLLQAVGVTCLVNDPPRAEREGGGGFLPLEALLDCDVLSLHVPLTRGGSHPTRHLVDAGLLGRLAEGALLINAARGAVVDNAALLTALERGRIRAALDTWEGEPAIRTELLARCALGTPHVAGYSLEGRLRGTEMVYQALCRHLGLRPSWRAAQSLPPADQLALPPAALGGEAWLRRLVLQVYDPRTDDRALRAVGRGAAVAAGFDRLRRDYPWRREFAAYRLAVAGLDRDRRQKLSAWGFQLA